MLKVSPSIAVQIRNQLFRAHLSGKLEDKLHLPLTAAIHESKGQDIPIVNQDLITAAMEFAPDFILQLEVTA